MKAPGTIPAVTFNLTQPANPPQAKGVPVTDICQNAQDARIKGEVLTLRLAANVLELLDESKERQHNFATATTLEKFLKDSSLDEDARMTPKQQTLFALDIASSILQLRQTFWYSLPLTKTAIKFLIRNAGAPEMAISGPFVEQIVEGGQGKSLDNSSGPDPKAALLELAILLLEIWHHKPLEMWAAKEGVEKLETLEARRIAAIRWLELTSERLPPYHLTAIEQCLAICSGRLRFWHESEFQKQYCENIIKPLRESCRAWHTPI